MNSGLCQSNITPSLHESQIEPQLISKKYGSLYQKWMYHKKNMELIKIHILISLNVLI